MDPAACRPYRRRKTCRQPQPVSYAEYKEGKPGQLRLRARDFVAGPVRLHRPVTAVLADNVVFDPSAAPTAADGAAHSRGWVCALAIESSDVVLDLGRKRISQSTRQSLLVRFCAAVFIGTGLFQLPSQGPFNMGGSTCIERVCIRNGAFGLSSHFQVFSPCCRGVTLTDLECKDFEVAAVQLNAASEVQLRQLVIGPGARPQLLGPAFTHAQLLVKELDLNPELDAQLRASSLLFGNGAVLAGDAIISELRRLLWVLECNIRDERPPFEGVEAGDVEWLREESKHVNGNLYGIAANGDAMLGSAIDSSVEKRQLSGVVIRRCVVQDLQSEVTIWPLAVTNAAGEQVKTAGKAVPHLRLRALTGEVVLSPLSWGQLLWLQGTAANAPDAKIDAFVRAATGGSPDVAASSLDEFLERGPFVQLRQDCMAHTPKSTVGIALKNLHAPHVADCEFSGLLQTGPRHGRHSELGGGDVCGVLLIDCGDAKIENVTGHGLTSAHGDTRLVAAVEGTTLA